MAGWPPLRAHPFFSDLMWRTSTWRAITLVRASNQVRLEHRPVRKLSSCEVLECGCECRTPSFSLPDAFILSELARLRCILEG